MKSCVNRNINMKTKIEEINKKLLKINKAIICKRMRECEIHENKKFCFI